MLKKFSIRSLTSIVLLIILVMPTTTLGQYSFGEWARDHGYSPGDVMPKSVGAHLSSPPISSLDGIGEFDWNTTPTETLSLGYNQISSVESGSFSELPNLKSLLLDSNNIASIESGAFSGLMNLRYLILSDNYISSIESCYFSELTNLETMILIFNNISSITSGVFSGLSNIKRLELSNNQITSIESGAFSGLMNLTLLHLYNNQITSIESGAFNECTNLTRLRLYNNQISSIESGDFGGLTNLTNLSLGGNRISSIESGAFSGMKNLMTLDLNNNQILEIKSGDFGGLTNLTNLNLQDNKISNIESGAFSGMKNLMELILTRNTALKEVNLAKANFLSLTHFSVEDNANIDSVSLRNAVINQASLSVLLDGGGWHYWEIGIGELDGITGLDLSGIDFVNITDLSPLYVMDDLTDLWLVDTQNIDAFQLDLLLDNLATVENLNTEGILYMTQANFDTFNTAGGGLLAAWDAELGHHVEIVIPEPQSIVLLLIFTVIAIARCRMKLN